jgi:hypothetical protein
LLAEIYRQIEDAEIKARSLRGSEARCRSSQGKKIEGLDVIDFKSVLLIFLPRVKERLYRALEYLRSSGQRLDGVYIAADSDYAPLERAVRKINEEYDVRVVADIIGKMADLALEACGASVEGPERVHLKDIVGTAWLPKEAASVIRDAVAKMIKAGDIQPDESLAGPGVLGRGVPTAMSEDEKHAWDRLPGESSKAYHHFCILPGHGCKPVAGADGRYPGCTSVRRQLNRWSSRWRG